MIALELFAGSRSFGKVAEQYGYNVISTDINYFDGIDIVGDILELPINTFTEIEPTIIWASPPCTYFSVASIGHHWYEDNTPKTKEAILGVEIVKKTLEIIKACKPTYFFIENPRGKLRSLPILKHIPRATVWYCRYGDKRAKPTDIWSNHLVDLFNPKGWQPKPECFNGNSKCHHEPAPRGSKTGTQGLSDNYTRSIIPEQLIKEIVISTL
tara:strand:- start:820 stop:1455 length:636 start_codon:yes stop_codon:yes gene_type:complete